ncbi:MAG: NAD(P)-dependent alcohol dehydrogenase [Candidatus Caldarchaeales archaeon]
MKAAVLYSPRNMGFEERDYPTIKSPDEVIVEMKNVGICHSDVHYYVHGRIGDFVVKKPIVLGHECSGVVVAKGDSVKHLEVGDRVVIEPAAPCRVCFYCKSGKYNICDNLRFMGTPPDDGAFREFLTWPSDFVYKIPEETSSEEGALIEPFSVALYSVRRGGLMPGNKVMILGAGTIGLMTLLAARESGASDIFITDVIDRKLKLAKDFGATATINVRSEDPLKTINYLTDGRGPDIVFDAVGIEETFNLALKSVRKGGKIVVIGLGFEELTKAQIINIPTKEIDVIGILRYANVFQDAIRLVYRKRPQITRLITHRLSFSDVIKGMRLAAEGGEEVGKIMIEIRGGK